MPVFEQHLTDLVEVSNLPGGISVLTFAWESRQHGPTAAYARTSDVERAIAHAQTSGGKIVTALADPEQITRWQRLRHGVGIPDIFTTVPFEVVEQQHWREQGGLPGVFADAASDAADADFTGSVTPEDLYAYDHRNGVLRSFVTNAPVTRAMFVEASARDYDLDALAPLLAEHPWVRAVHFDAGRPGNYDHIAASLHVVVVLPQEVFAAFEEATQGTPGALEEALFYSPLLCRGTSPSGGCSALGDDPLGIAAAMRVGRYPEPSEEWDLSPTYPALEASLPSERDLYSS